MPTPKPLTPGQAKRSLAQRFTKTADRLRQLNTRFGVRPYQVFMVYVRWTGDERGQGTPIFEREDELLPTPKVTSLDSVTFSIFHAGTVPAGSVKLTEVSGQRTYDELFGKMLPRPHMDAMPQPWDFFYELREDGRGDDPAVRNKYRVMSPPFRDAINLQWTILLERISQDRGRDGSSQYLKGTET